MPAVTDPLLLPATEQRRLLQSGALTSVALTQGYLDRISQFDKSIGAYLRVSADAALAQAADVDRRRSRGEAVGALAGLPVAVKDVLCQQGELTTCASRMLADFRPPYDATVVAKLKSADAVLIGRTNMDEFAMGGSTENSALGRTANPWDLTRSPGGSSGGAAACIAARLASLAVGTDTGGSVRQPAALCGVVGLKPTYGRVSRYGLVAFASSLDQVGPLGSSVADVAMLLEAIAGHDASDSTSLQAPVPCYSAELGQPLRGLRLGVVREHFAAGLDSEIESAVRQAIAQYESLGATCVQVSFPHAKYAVATYYVIAPCEASSNLARYDGIHYGYRADQKRVVQDLEIERRTAQERGGAAAVAAIDSALVRLYRDSRAEGFGPEVKRRIMLGTYALSAGYYDAYYLKAMRVRRLIRQDYDRAFEQVDAIVGPVTPGPAFQLGELCDDPLALYLLDLYTVSANLAGLPALSLPCGFTESGLPIGLQLQGPPLAEAKLLSIGHALQQATDWHTQFPPWCR